MSPGWIVVLGLGVATAALRAVGPVLLGGRALPTRLLSSLGLVAPALLAALVATQVFATGQDLVIDARAAGLVVAVVALVARASTLVVIGSAAATTALARLFA